MISRIVHSSHPVTLVGGGEIGAHDLQEALRLAPTCVAVDGGADAVLAAGLRPEAVIGDLDSLSDTARDGIDPSRVLFVDDQNTTDFEKALQHVTAPAYVCVGFTGARNDHHLAACHALLANPAKPAVLLSASEIILLAPPRLSLPAQEGDVISLFPLQRVTGQSSGLAWPIDGLVLEPGKRIGTSNRALGPVTLRVHDPGLLLILPRRLLAPLLPLLCDPQAARWPAPA